MTTFKQGSDVEVQLALVDSETGNPIVITDLLNIFVYLVDSAGKLFQSISLNTEAGHDEEIDIVNDLGGIVNVKIQHEITIALRDGNYFFEVKTLETNAQYSSSTFINGGANVPVFVISKSANKSIT